ncbi:DUF2213 domain-containing protein [Acetobacter indonesiensis]|uniref:DUF2213 domain-containing protein n=1 Tax=Acetobacter indonesiensis TaxID=104101 RepID=UPI0039ED48C1
MRIHTTDFAPSRGTDLYSIEKIGDTRERLPDGALLCRDVPIARTGQMEYDESELEDVNGERCTSPDGVVRVARDEAQLFNARTVSSFEGVPVTLGHHWITPDTASEFSKGFIRNVRRGDGDLADYLLADLVIRSRDAIDAIEKSGIREVSPGYDADYERMDGKPGHYSQGGIIGNHLAIVERGRGGRRVRVGDNERKQMAFKKKTWGSRLLNAISTNDEEGVEEAIRDGSQEAPDGDRVEPTLDRRTRDEDPMTQCMSAISCLGEKIDTLPGLVAEAVAKALAGTGDEDPNNKPSDDADKSKREDEKRQDDEARSETEDEAECLTEEGKRIPTGDAAFAAVRQATVSTAAILAPGYKPGTMDSAAPSREKRSGIIEIRRLALESALAGPNKALVARYVPRKGVRAMTSDALFTAFNAAGEAVRNQNRGSVFSGVTGRAEQTGDKSAVTAADINERNRAFYKR